MFVLWLGVYGEQSLTCSQYRGWDPEKAIQDYYKRIHDHEQHYQTVDETEWPSIRIMNVSPNGYLTISY